MGYFTYVAPNGVTLHNYTTTPDKIKLLNYEKQGMLTSSKYYGINAGWFNMETGPSDRRTLTIAYYNGKPVGPTDTWGGSTIPRDGTYNDTGRQAISYIGGSFQYYTSIENAKDMNGITNTGTWAQGGMALNLGKESWTADIAKYGYSSGTAACAWSAMVVDLRSTNKVVYLIVAKDPKGGTSTKLSIKDFRDAINKMLNITDSGSTLASNYRALLLDGSASSQMRTKDGNTIVTVDSKAVEPRAVCQILYYDQD